MEFQSSQIKAVTVVVARGRIDHRQAQAFQDGMAPYIAACKEGGSPLLLDFSGVDYISSVGLRSLMLVARTVGAQMGKIAIAAVQPAVREVLQISRFHLVLKIHDTVDAGIAALGAEA